MLKSIKTYIIPEGYILKSVKKIPDIKKWYNTETRQKISTAIQLTGFYVTQNSTVRHFSDRV